MGGEKTRSAESIQYTFVPNRRETMQALAMANFTNQEFRIIIALMNQTNGYLREEDTIASTFWQALTFMSRPSVFKTLRRLIEKGVIAKSDGAYRLRSPNEWPPSVFGSPRACRRAIGAASDLLAREKQPEQYRWLRDLLKPLLTGNATRGENRSPQATQRFPQATVRFPQATIRLPPGNDLATSKEGESSKESTKEKAAKKTSRGDPRVKRVLDTISQELGTEIPFYAKEAAAVKRALQMGHTVEQIVGCWRQMNTFTFWQGQWLPLAKVTENLGKFVAGRLTDGKSTRDSGKAPPRRGKVRGAEDYRW
jgi:phage replication O-like protein O